MGEVEEVEDLLQEGAHPHAAMDLPAMRVHQTGGVIVQQAMTELLQDPMTVHLHPNPMTELLQNPLDSLTRAGPRWPSVKPTWTSRLGRSSHFFKGLAGPTMASSGLVNYQPPGFLNNLSAILLAYSYICGRTLSCRAGHSAT